MTRSASDSGAEVTGWIAGSDCAIAVSGAGLVSPQATSEAKRNEIAVNLIGGDKFVIVEVKIVKVIVVRATVVRVTVVKIAVEWVMTAR